MAVTEWVEEMVEEKDRSMALGGGVRTLMPTVLERMAERPLGVKRT